MGTFFLMVSCASVHPALPESSASDLHLRSEVQTSLGKPKSLFQQGKFSEAIVQYRKLTRNKDKSVAETAQYQLAYTFAYYKNMGRDYQEALNEFQLFLKKYPESSLKEEAANWVSLLNQAVMKQSENELLRDNIKRLVDIDIEGEQKQRPSR